MTWICSRQVRPKETDLMALDQDIASDEVVLTESI
jgi:hypothetical protein